ncbi:MAG: class I SAM-dependent methyltransferase [Acidobacteria bacterium]|nr:class I SAM-dependent methyltransferase [Acidobacteriota bacterium]
MIRTVLLSIFLALILAAGSLAQHTHGGDYQRHHVPTSAEEWIKTLEEPKRDEWQKPHEVVQSLALIPGSTVADIGAGSGYFALRFAHMLGPQGKVLAVDIDQKLVDHVRERAAELKLANVEAILAATDDPHLAAGTADVIFFCDVIHHIEGRPAYYKLLKRALRPGGRLVIIDFHKCALPVGPPPEMKIAREEMIRELEAAGFRVAREHGFLPYQYFLEFEQGAGS